MQRFLSVTVLPAAALLVLIGVGRAADEAAAPAPAPAAAAQVDVWPVAEKPEAMSLKTAIGDLKMKPMTPAPAQVTALQNYYQKFALARWTQPEEAARIAESGRGYRNELRREFPTYLGGVHDAANTIVLKLLQKMATDNCHSVARANAMLAIGELNTTEPATNVNAVPYAQAIPVMVAELTAKEQIDCVRVAALTGLIRFAKAKALPPNDPNVPAIVTACLALVGAKDVPEDRSPDGHGWLRAQAAELLGELGSAGNGGAVAAALGNLAGESGASLVARREAARALAKLNYAGADLGNAPAAIVAGLTKYAADVCAAEETGKYSKRRAKYRMAAASEALAALKAVAANATANLEPVLGTMIKAINDSKDEDTVAPAALAEQRAKLQPAAK